MSGKPKKKYPKIPGHTTRRCRRNWTALNSAPSRKNAAKGGGKLTSRFIGRFTTSMQTGPAISNR